LVLDGLTVVLDGRPAGQRVALTEVRTRTPRHASSPRVAEVLADLGLLDDGTTPAIRQWIHRRASELPAGFAEPVRAWLGVLLDGDARTRPRSQPTLYVFFGAVRPFLQRWSAQRGHLREVTAGDVDAALEPLRGHQRRNAITALRSLFRFAKKRGLVFANPTTHLATTRIDPGLLLPMTDAEIRAVQRVAVNPAQRLIVALAAVHAARIAAIRHLLLDDLDLPNRRITIAGHTQRLGELTDRALRAWLQQRRTAWPHTPNRHVLVSEKTALGVAPISKGYFHYHLRRHDVDLDRIRKDRILPEALTVGPDPLHLALVFNLSHTTASRYATIAQHLLDGQLEQPPNSSSS
jgi:integrase